MIELCNSVVYLFISLFIKIDPIKQSLWCVDLLVLFILTYLVCSFPGILSHSEEILPLMHCKELISLIFASKQALLFFNLFKCYRKLNRTKICKIKSA